MDSVGALDICTVVLRISSLYFIEELYVLTYVCLYLHTKSAAAFLAFVRGNPRVSLNVPSAKLFAGVGWAYEGGGGST